ncbi:hydrogenase-4 component G [Thiovibrio sp. JS02]
MDIAKVKTGTEPFKAAQEKADKGGAARAKSAEATETPAAAEVSLALKAKMVETVLAVKTEAKAGFASQSGVSRRAGGQGFEPATLQYDGKPISELTPEEAQALIAEDGYFGVARTARRIADFVLTGGGDDLARLQAGREGVLRGFAEAEEIWGGKLPEISYQTLNRALELIDARIQELGGGSLLDVTA